MAQFDLELLYSGAQQLDVELSEKQGNLLLEYLQLMLRWNAQMNLTAITNPDEMLAGHVFDAFAALPFFKGEKILDVGSGAGLPGMVLAIIKPDWEFVLLDSRAKRVGFLRNVVAKLQLTNVNAVHARVEGYSVEQKFDTITARAFAPLDKMLDMTLHLLAEQGRIVALKGKIAQEEIGQLPQALRDKAQLHEVNVPHVQARRAIVTLDY